MIYGRTKVEQMTRKEALQPDVDSLLSAVFAGAIMYTYLAGAM